MAEVHQPPACPRLGIESRFQKEQGLWPLYKIDASCRYARTAVGNAVQLRPWCLGALSRHEGEIHRTYCPAFQWQSEQALLVKIRYR